MIAAAGAGRHELRAVTRSSIAVQLAGRYGVPLAEADDM